jgi:hypothetical protein
MADIIFNAPVHHGVTALFGGQTHVTGKDARSSAPIPVISTFSNRSAYNFSDQIIPISEVSESSMAVKTNSPGDTAVLRAWAAAGALAIILITIGLTCAFVLKKPSLLAVALIGFLLWFAVGQFKADKDE